MRRLCFPLLLILTASLLAAAEPAPDKSLAKARAQYPVQVCIVSGEHLDPGQIVDYIHQEPGQPDRLVRLCCHKCVARFKADPAKFLKKLDDLAAKAGRKS